MKAALYAACFAVGFCVCLLLLRLGVFDFSDQVRGAEAEPMLSLPTYLSFLSVMLTAVTVVLAALAIGIGVVAAFTFSGLKEEARRASAKIAEEISAQVAEQISAEVAQKVAGEALSDDHLYEVVGKFAAKSATTESANWDDQEWRDDENSSGRG